MLNETQDFYFLDDKLLYAGKDFIGFNPTVSKALTPERLESYGTKIVVDEFDMLGNKFNVILTNFRGSGPLRGYKGIEILKNGETIIRYKEGGGLGAVYGKGSYLLVDNASAYLVADGNTLIKRKINEIYPDIVAGGFYFFWFTDVIIPTLEEIIINYEPLEEKESYTIKEINHLRQVEWHVKAIINDREISISKSSIPGFCRINRSSPGYEKFRKDIRLSDMSETKIVIDSITQLYEN